MNPYSFSTTFFGFSTFLIGIFIWLKRGDAIGKIYFIFSIFVAGWGVCFGIMVNDHTPYEQALLYARISNISALIFPTFWYHFTCRFAELENEKRLSILLIYLTCFVIAATGASSLFIPAVVARSGLHAYPTPGFTYHLFTLSFFIISGMGFANLMTKYRVTTAPGEKRQMLGFLLATSSGFVGGGMTFLGVYGIEFPQYNLFMMPIYPFVMAYFMVRENLFDAEKFAVLAHQEKMATIAALAASVNHEIKNPLYITKSQAEVFLDKENQGEADSLSFREGTFEFARKVHTQASRAMEIMQKFAAFAKVNPEPDQVRTRLDSAIDNVLHMLSYEVEVDKIKINQSGEQNLKLFCDPRDLEQILFNLIRNAAQEIGENGVVSITSKRKGERVKLTIKDNGPGIAQERLDQVFEPFYSTKKEGSGVGLYVTKKLVERNHGWIHVKSKIGEGTVFTMELKNESI